MSGQGELISARMRELSASGKHVNRTPLGYRREGRGLQMKIVPDEPTASLIKESIEAIAGGMSLRRALAKATAMGLRNGKGKELSLSSFHLVVTNPFYVGIVRANGHAHPGEHEALIGNDVFRKAQTVLGHHRT